MRLSLSLNRRVTALTLVLLPVLLLLANWQLHRAEEKRAIAATYAERSQQAPVSVDGLDESAELAFTPVVLEGRFDEQHSILLDNRVMEGRPGYEVLTPLVTEGGQWVLVNRGWIEGNPDRRQLPPIPSADRVERTQGTVYVPPGEPFLLAEQKFRDIQWPLLVQAVDMDKFSSLLGRDFFPYVIRLNERAPGALRVDWQAINVQPEKHTAYAVQWFAMALGLTLWFIFANTNLLQLLKAFMRRPQE